LKTQIIQCFVYLQPVTNYLTPFHAHYNVAKVTNDDCLQWKIQILRNGQVLAASSSPIPALIIRPLFLFPPATKPYIARNMARMKGELTHIYVC